jgi:hypothetical protein
MTLDALLAPHDKGMFVRDIMGQSAMYVSGSCARFDKYMSWPVINHLLEFGGLTYPRLRVIGGGHELPTSVYLKNGRNGYPRLLVEGLTSALRDGAMLAIESIEDLHEPMSCFCHSLERALEVPVQADVFATWQDKPLPEWRWSDHETFVLQVQGTRLWNLTCPTAAYPFIKSPPPPPAGDPAWSGLLSPGDVLYIPSGWWYCDQPVEAALFCAVKFRNPTCLDAVYRLVEQMLSNYQMRAPLPRFANADKQSGFIALVQRELASATAQPGLFLGFLKDARDSSEPRVRFNLPWSAQPTALPPSDEYLVIPLVRFPCKDTLRHVGSDAIEILMDEQVIRLRPGAAEIFELLCDSSAPTVRTLIEGCSNTISREEVLECLSELVRNGVVSLKDAKRADVAGYD